MHKNKLIWDVIEIFFPYLVNFADFNDNNNNDNNRISTQFQFQFVESCVSLIYILAVVAAVCMMLAGRQISSGCASGVLSVLAGVSLSP